MQKLLLILNDPPSMAELTEWTLWADKVLSF